MTLSMHQASVPVFLRGLENLAAILAKGAAHAEAKKIDPAVFINARLAGVDVPSFADTETTFPELQARIAKTIDFVNGFKAAQIDGSEERTCILKVRGEEMKFRGQDYLFKLSLPNFFFHVTTTYDILRHNGVELGKMDYLGRS